MKQDKSLSKKASQALYIKSIQPKQWQWVLKDSEIQILLYMSHPNHMYAIFKDVNMAYSHLVKTVKLMESKKLLSTELKGRQRIVHITKKGIAVQLLLDRIEDAMR